MPFDPSLARDKCKICEEVANIIQQLDGTDRVNCLRCGDYVISDHEIAYIESKRFQEERRAIASYIIRKTQRPGAPPPRISKALIQEIEGRSLPRPIEASDNLLIWIAEQAGASPGREIELPSNILRSIIGALNLDDIRWHVDSLVSQDLLKRGDQPAHVRLTAKGWRRIEELKRAHVAFKFAFFARQFDNAELDRVFHECLFPAVQATGYELRIAPQRAGLIDAIIEDEIRRCRFLIADLSDDNAGAYWEAGFAQGLGKDVIYICRDKEPDGSKKKTHFDTDHRHTVRWDLESMGETAKRLKAVIRNTLLGDANQSDEWCRRECGWNWGDAITGHLKVSCQAARSTG